VGDLRASSRWLMASCPHDCSPSAEGQHSPAHLSPGEQCDRTETNSLQLMTLHKEKV